MAGKYEKEYTPDAGTLEAVQVSLGQVMKAVEQLSKDVRELTGEVNKMKKRLRNV